MKPEFASSSDFNQMLVVSVFLHLFFIVVLMYMPKPKAPQRVIVSTFNVQMVDAPSGISSGAQTPAREKEVPKPKQEAAPPPEVKPLPEAKPAAPPPPPKPEAKKIAGPPVKKPETASSIVKELESLSGKPKKPKVAEELDRLAQLKPSGVPQKRPEKKPLPLKETFRELDDLKARKTEAQKPFLPAPPKVEEPLEGFDSLKMKEPAPPEIKKAEKPAPKKESVDLQELELQAMLSRKAAADKEKKEKTAAELLKELERTADLQAVKPALPAPEKKKPAREIDISISSGQKSSEEFSSLLRKLEIPAEEKTPAARKDARAEEGKLPQGAQSQAALSQAKPGPLATDILSLYVGTIREKVLSNWKSPLGAEHNEVVVSFFIFPQGNIGKPFVDNSSGADQLDTLAVRAILDSEPFPKFPAELKEPNLHITIRFKYVYQQ